MFGICDGSFLRDVYNAIYTRSSIISKECDESKRLLLELQEKTLELSTIVEEDNRYQDYYGYEAEYISHYIYKYILSNSDISRDLRNILFEIVDRRDKVNSYYISLNNDNNEDAIFSY